MPFGLTEHLGASFSWWKSNKYSDTYGAYKDVPYDGNDPEFREFYFDNYEHLNSEKRNNAELIPWYTNNKEFHKYWLDVMKEVIDLYEPDLLYSDGVLPFGGHWYKKDSDGTFTVQGDKEYNNGLEAVAYLYNKSIQKYGENRAVYNQKDRRKEIYSIGILDIEKSQLPDILSDPWQTDTCIGNWIYDVRQVYKKPGHIIEMLIDIISKNGNMLLNILQKPDGTIDDEAKYILEELAKWFAVCSEAVYETRPWRISSEGNTKVIIDGFKELKTDWNSSDFRFTSNGNIIYAFMLCTPEDRVAVIHSLTEADKVVSVKLLGANELPFAQSFGKLTIKLPDVMPTIYTNCVKIQLS
jgi:alpha-L-fucosidase